MKKNEKLYNKVFLFRVVAKKRLAMCELVFRILLYEQI